MEKDHNSITEKRFVNYTEKTFSGVNPSNQLRETSVDNDEPSESRLVAQQAVTRFGLLSDVEGVVCDFDAVATRKKLVEVILNDSGNHPYADDSPETLIDLSVIGGEIIASNPANDRRTALITELNNGVSLTAWTELPKKRLFRDRLTAETLGNRPITLGLTFVSMNDKSNVYVPLMTSIKSGVEGECHVVAASDSEVDMLEYATDELAQLAYDLVSRGNSVDFSVVENALLALRGVYDARVDQFGRTELLDLIAERALGSGSTSRDAHVKNMRSDEIDKFEKLPVTLISASDDRARKYNALIGGLHDSEEVFPSGRSALGSNYLVDLGYHQRTNGLLVRRLSLLKGYSVKKYGPEKGKVVEWAHIDYPELGRAVVSFLDDDGVGYREPDVHDSEILDKLSANVIAALMKRQRDTGPFRNTLRLG